MTLVSDTRMHDRSAKLLIRDTNRHSDFGVTAVELDDESATDFAATAVCLLVPSDSNHRQLNSLCAEYTDDGHVAYDEPGPVSDTGTLRKLHARGVRIL